MFANSFQSGFLTIFYSIGSTPLAIWDTNVKNGHIRRIMDKEIKSLVLEIAGTNVATTFITCPNSPRASLGIKLPFIVMVMKNMKKYFTFEIQIIDDKDMRRRFRVSNFQSTTKVRPFCTTMPVSLSPGWNQVQLNLADFTRRAYDTLYMETIRVQIHANVRIRRIYFTDRLYDTDELPNEYKLMMPMDKEKAREVAKAKEEAKARIMEKLKKAKRSTVTATEVVKGVPPAAPPTPTYKGEVSDEEDRDMSLHAGVDDLHILDEHSEAEYEVEDEEEENYEGAEMSDENDGLPERPPSELEGTVDEFDFIDE